MTTRREVDAPTVLLQGRVLPEHRNAVRHAAGKSRMSMSLYIDSLIRHLLVEGNDELPILDNKSDDPVQEQLPVNKT